MSTFNLRTLGLVGPIIAMAAVAACSTMGTGTGNARNSDLHANFAWKSTDDRTGTLTATLSNGETFSGPFFQVSDPDLSGRYVESFLEARQVLDIFLSEHEPGG